MSKGIRMSPKHGVNASCTVCFFCGKETGLAFLGHLKGDVKAPQRIVANYIPCDECAEKHKQGRVVIEAVQHQTGLPPIMKGVWATGRWCLISKEASEKLFNDGKDTPVLLEDTLYKQLVEGSKNE